MSTVKIEIAGTSYPLKFGFGAFRLLGEKWGCKGMQGVIKEFQTLIPSSGKKDELVDIAFDDLDKIAELTHAGIENAGAEFPEGKEFINDTIDALVFGGNIQLVMNAFSSSLPQGNPMPEKKSRQTKKGKKK